MVVLVIEDSSTMRQLLCHAVGRIPGAIVVEATDGANALAKLADICPDVVVTDINMPEMDGFAFIARLRQLPEHVATPVIVLTTAATEEDRERARELGVAAYVTKPIRHQDVVAAIMRVAGLQVAGEDAVVLHVDYDDADDLVADYAATLSRGELVVSNRRALAPGTPVRLALAFPGLADPIQLDGLVRSSTEAGGADPECALVIELAGGQHERLARAIEAIAARQTP